MSSLLLTLGLLALLAAPASAVCPGPDSTSVKLRVEVDGVSDELRENVLAHLAIERRSRDGELFEAQIRRLHREAGADIARALEPFGYYRPIVESELTHDGNEWLARYRIDPGEPVRVRTVDIRILGAGSEDAAFRSAAASFPLAPGDRLDHTEYEQGKRALQLVAAERGYLDADFRERNVFVDREALAARIVLHLETGPRYRFGAVHFEEIAIEEALLEGMVPFSRGDEFTTAALRELQEALQATDLFSSVEVGADRERAEGLEVPVRVSLRLRPRSRYEVGVGYGTDTGPRVTLGAEKRRLNRSGHSATAEVRASFVQNGLNLRYAIPMRSGVGHHAAFSLGYLYERPEASRRSTLQVGASLNHSRYGWRETFYLNYRLERFEVGADARTDGLLLPGVSWSRTRTNDLTYPTRGHKVVLDVRGSHEAVGADGSFLQGIVRAKLVRSLSARGRILLRAEAGLTAARDVSVLPASVRFFAGGDRSVRGYGYEALGPIDENGDNTGGRHLLTGSIEYEYRIGQDWGAAIFTDAGNAVERLPLDLKHSAGIGGRWHSPVGLVRVDLAAALSKPGTPLKLHLIIGPDL